MLFPLLSFLPHSLEVNRFVGLFLGYNYWTVQLVNPSADRMKLEIKANDIWLIKQWPGSALNINQCILSSALILVDDVFCEKQERGSGEEAEDKALNPAEISRHSCYL